MNFEMWLASWLVPLVAKVFRGKRRHIFLDELTRTALKENKLWMLDLIERSR